MSEQTIYDVEVRTPSPDELELVRALRHTVLDPGRSRDFETEVSKRDLDPSTIHVAAFVDNAPVSAVRLDQKDEGLYEVRKMATLEAFRGKGIGGNILRVAEAQATKRGAKTIVLAARKEAVNFYAGLGYEPTGEEVTHDDDILNFKMKKEVANGKQA